MHRVQARQLQLPQKQKNHQGTAANEQVLQVLRQTYAAQRDEVNPVKLGII